MLADLHHPFAEGEPAYDVTFENVQAGLRTDYLFRIANQNDAIVLGTGDLSELALGWCTYGVGDQMSHYNVNAGVPKTLIQHLIGWVARNYAEVEAADQWLQANYWDDARLIRQMQAAHGLPLQPNRLRIRHIKPRMVQPNIASQTPGQQRMLLGRIAAQQQNRRCRGNLFQACRASRRADKQPVEGGVISRPFMIDMLRLQHCPRKLLQQIILFVGRARRADHANRPWSVLASSVLARATPAHNLLESLRHMPDRLLPRRRLQHSGHIAHQRLGQSLGALHKIKSKAAFRAEKISIDAAFVAVVCAHNLHAVVGASHTQRHLASVGAMRANGRYVLHLPRT